PGRGWRGAGDRLGGAPRRRRVAHRRRPDPALSARARRAAAGRRSAATAMRQFFLAIEAFFRGLFGRTDPVLSEAGPRDAGAISVLHGACFRRGWSEDEVERLLLDASVVAHRATIGRELAGFILSRMAAGEAEILSVAVAPRCRGRGLAAKLLMWH